MTFLESLARLPSREQNRVRESLAPLLSGRLVKSQRLHKVGAFLSFSPTMELRILGTGALESLTLLYVDHHEAAYRWAESHAPVLDDSGAIIELVETSRSVPPPTGPVSGARRTAYTEIGLPAVIADYLATLDDDRMQEAVSILAPEYHDPVLSIATGGSAGAPPFRLRASQKSTAASEATEVASWARLVTRRVVGQFLEAIARSPALRRLYIISPWISEVEDTTRLSLAQLRKRLVDEGGTAYVVTRPPDHDWHRTALDGFRDTRRANVVTATSVHSKLFCADTGSQMIALFGSANFTQKSLDNREIGLLVHDYGEGRQVVRQLVQEAAEIYRTIPDRRFYCRLIGG